MKENHKIVKYPSGNIKIETYEDGNTSVTKNYYDGKNAYVRELIYLTDGLKKIKHTNINGVVTKVEHFVDDKRHGIETKYSIAKADGSVKSTKAYEDGKLHGENLIYNENAEVVKHEVFALGKCVLKYLREDSESNDITGVEILDKDNVQNLPKIEYEKLQNSIETI